MIPGIDVKFKDYLICGLISIGLSEILSIPDYLYRSIKHIPVKDIDPSFTGIIWFILSLFIDIIGSFSLNAYADSFCFKDAFRFKRIFNLMLKVKVEILICLTIYFILDKLTSPLEWGFIAATRHLHFTAFAFLISKVITIPIFGTVFGLIFFNLEAQIYKIAKNRLENKEIAIPEADLQYQTFEVSD